MKSPADSSASKAWLLIAGLSVIIGLMGVYRVAAGGGSAASGVITIAIIVFVIALRGRPHP